MNILNPIHFISTGFGIGFFVYAPGTVGSIFFIPLLLEIVFIISNKILSYLVFLILFFLGVFICERTSKDIKVHDCNRIIFDELVSIFFMLILIKEITFLKIFVNFLLFRIFDILKPYPISFIDKLNNGFGIMFDDFIAAIFSLMLSSIFF